MDLVGTLLREQNSAHARVEFVYMIAMIEIRRLPYSSAMSINTQSELPHLIFLVDTRKTSAECSCILCKLKWA